MRDVAPQQLQGLRPVDPEGSTASMQGGLIKFRVAAADKRLIADAAARAGTTVSELLRRAGRAAASGRITSRPMLSDLVLVRTAANRLATLMDAPDADPAVIAARVKETVEDLRAIAARHLANIR
jgi:uncharacterized protein (DUF1778 family)